MPVLTRSHSLKTVSARKRDSELVQNGFHGCLQIANSLAYRFYRHQFGLQEDREQAAALAAMEAYALASDEFTLREATKSIRAVLYRQVKAYGFRMVNTRREDGSRTANWVNCEIPFSVLSDFNRQAGKSNKYEQNRKEHHGL